MSDGKGGSVLDTVAEALAGVSSVLESEGVRVPERDCEGRGVGVLDTVPPSTGGRDAV